MKMISGKVLSVILAFIIAMPVILAFPFSSSAQDNDNEYFKEHLIAQYFTDSNLTEDKVGDSDLETVGTGATWRTTGLYKAAKFPGGSQGSKTNYYRVRLNNMFANISGSRGITISFIGQRGGDDWERYFELSSNGGFGDGNSSSYLYFSCNSNAKVKNQAYGNSETGSPNISDDGAWHQWTLTINRSSFIVYCDGFFRGRIEDTSRINDAWFNLMKEGYLLLGASSYSADQLFSGSLSNFRIYDVAFTPLQARYEYVSRPSNHTEVNVRYKTAVNFHGTEGTDFAISNENYYYSPQDSVYGLHRYSSAHSINVDDNYKYFRMWDKNDKLTYYDSSDSEEGIFQNESDFRFDVDLGSRQDSASEFLIGIFDKSGNFPIKLLKNGNLSINGREINGIDSVYTGDNEKFLNNYTFSFDYSKQILHYSCYGECVDSGHNFAIERDISLSSYGISINPGNLSGIDILNGAGDGHTRFGGIYFYLPYEHITADLQGLKAAVALYESKMRNGKIYSNTLDAYNAYVLANRYIDAAEYGNRVFTEAEYQEIANTLEVATNNMTVWSPKRGTYHARFDGDNDYISDSDYSKTYVNVLWANNVTQDPADSAVYEDELAIYQGSEKCNPRLFHPSAVLMYDGKNVPAIPVLSYFRHWCTGSHTYNIYYSAIFLNSNTDSLEINSKWRNGSGGGGNESFNYQWHYLNNQEVEIVNYNTFDTAQHWGKYFVGSMSWNIGYANQIRFHAVMGDNEYKRTLDRVNWGFNFYNQLSNKKEIRVNSSKPIYVINYKILTDALSRATSKTAQVNKYKEGGMLEFFTTYDEATKFDPQSAFDYSYDTSNQVDRCAQKIKSLRESLDNSTYGLQDTYQALRDEMKQSHDSPTGNSAEVDYNTPISQLNQTYTYNSISAFRRAYKNSIREMNLLVENGYSSAPATLEALRAAHSSLEELADFSSLDAAKANALARAVNIDTGIYTVSSVASYNDNLTSQFEFPYEYLGDRTNTGVTEQSLIDAEAQKFNNAESIFLKKRSKMAYFDETYQQAIDFLEGMEISAPMYLESDVNAFIDLIGSEDVSKYAQQSAEERSDYAEGGAEELESVEIADDIKAAMNSMKHPENTVDISAYQQAIFIALDSEDDAYDYPESERDKDMKLATALISKTIDYNGMKLKVVNESAAQNTVDVVTSLVQSKLSTHIRTYTIEIAQGSVSENDGITFNNGTLAYNSATGLYEVSYNTTVNLKADSYSAWYMEFESQTASRGIQYQGSGKRFSAKVIGNLKVYVYNSQGNHRLMISRKYSDSDKEVLSLEMFTTGSYTLPEPQALAFYTFSGYTIDGVPYNPGDVITVDKDTFILADYTLSESLDCAVNIDGEAGISASYNDKLSLEGNSDTYAWLELDKSTNTFKPFYIGRDLTFLVTESITLKKVNQEEFAAAKYRLPAINIRQDGTYSTVTDGVKKVYFNGQYVDDGSFEIAEYGIILGKATDGGSVKESDVVLENIGVSEDYTLHRFKSTKNVGANQFTIGVKNLSGDVIYKGYLTYKLSDSEYVTVYTDAISESL